MIVFGIAVSGCRITDVPPADAIRMTVENPVFSAAHAPSTAAGISFSLRIQNESDHVAKLYLCTLAVARQVAGTGEQPPEGGNCETYRGADAVPEPLLQSHSDTVLVRSLSVDDQFFSRATPIRTEITISFGPTFQSSRIFVSPFVVPQFQ